MNDLSEIYKNNHWFHQDPWHMFYPANIYIYVTTGNIITEDSVLETYVTNVQQREKTGNIRLNCIRRVKSMNVSYTTREGHK